MSTQSSATLEDYKKYVRELKSRIRHLSEKNKSLTDELATASKNNTNKQAFVQDNPATFAIKLSKQAIQIQRIFRGYLTRKKFLNLKAKQSTKIRLGTTNGISNNNDRADAKCMLKFKKSLDNLGFSLEMLFRAVDSECKGEVPVDNFRSFLSKCKIQVNRDDIAAFLFLLDEEGNGIITEQEYASAIFAFGVSTESKSTELAKTFLYNTLTKFYQQLTGNNLNIDVYFREQNISFSDFLNFISMNVEDPNSLFREKERAVLISYFDRMKRGYIEKRFLIGEIARIPQLSEPKMQSRIRNRSPLYSPSKQSANPKLFEELENEEGAQSTITTNHQSKINFSKILDKDLLKNFVGYIEKTKLGLDNFFNSFGTFLLQNNSQISVQSNIPIDLLKQFLEEHFSSQLQSNDIDRVCKAICPKRSIQISKLRLLITQDCNTKPDLSNFIKINIAIICDQEGIETNDFFSRFGFSFCSKLDFSQFFILGQKTVEANFAESTSLFNSLKPIKDKISLSTLINDINQLRSRQASTLGNPREDLEEIQRKVTIETLDALEGILGSISRNTEKIQLNKVDLKQIDNLELSKLANYMENSQGGVRDLLEFVVENMAKNEDKIEIYMSVIANYLNQKEKDSTTSEFFKRYKIHPQGFYEKGLFEKRIIDIFGLTKKQADFLVLQFIDKETDSVNVSEFVERIEKCRFGNLNQTSGNKTEEKNLISKQRPEVNKTSQNEDRKMNTQPSTYQTPLKDTKSGNDSRQENKKQEDEKNNQGQINQVQNNQQNEANNPAICVPQNLQDEIITIKKDKSQSDLSRLSLKELSQKLEQYKNQYFHELKHLDQMILMSDPEELNITQLKQIIKPIMPLEVQQLLILFFIKCDKIKNGMLDMNAWEQFSLDAGLRTKKLEKSQKSSQSQTLPALKSIRSDSDFVNQAIGILNELKIPIELLDLVHTEDNQPISILQIRREAGLLTNNNEDAVKLFMQLIRYLDQDKNASFSVGQVKLLLMLIHFNDKKKLIKDKFHLVTLVNFGISIDKIKEVALQNEQSISLIYLADHLLSNFENYENLWSIIQLLVETVQTTNSANISINDFYQKTEISKYISSPINKLNQSPQKEKLELEIFSLRMEDRSKIIAKASKNLKSLFDSNDQLRIIGLILYYQNEKAKSQNTNFKASISNNDTKKEAIQVQQKSKLNDSEIDEIIRSKILQIGLNSKQINDAIDPIISQTNQLNFSLFTSCFELNNLTINSDILLQLFNRMKDSNEIKIKGIALKSYLSALAISNKPLSESNQIQSSGNPLEQIIKLFKSEFENYQINQSKDYFQGRNTIFNNPIAALKVALFHIQKQSKEGNLFEDIDFGPTKEDPLGHHSIYFEEIEPGMVDPEEIVWLRPSQISKDDPPQFLNDGAQTNDVIQGAIGDCWFISALSILAVDDQNFYSRIEDINLNQINDLEISKLLQGVYPVLFHPLAQFGMYIFKFFKDNDWRYIIIDDRLPCYAGSEDCPDLIFARCDSRSEFWVPLLEKAYAKLHGTYQALINGQIDDALVDMTGCVSEKIKLKNAKNEFDVKSLGSPEALWDKLQRDIESKSMMGCSISGAEIEGRVSINGEFVGLVSGHAYSLMDLIDIGQFKLVRIRNPWGSAEPMEWNGAWSDNSQELVSNLKEINSFIRKRWKDEAEELQEESKDGTFLMEYNEFLSVWTNISICRNFPDNWSGVRFRSEWKHETAGGTPYTSNPDLFASYLKNPMLNVTVTKNVELFVSLSQEDGRVKSKGAEPFPFASFIFPLSLSIFEINTKDKRLTQFDPKKMKSAPIIKNYRDIQVSVKLSPGSNSRRRGGSSKV